MVGSADRRPRHLVANDTPASLRTGSRTCRAAVCRRSSARRSSTKIRINSTTTTTSKTMNLVIFRSKASKCNCGLAAMNRLLELKRLRNREMAVRFEELRHLEVGRRP